MKLAQLNIALAKYPLDAPEIREFVDNLGLLLKRVKALFGV